MDVQINFELEELQDLFNTDFIQLEEADEDELEYIEQCHFGDLLIETTEVEHRGNPRRAKLWKKLDTNGGGLLIEYSGVENNYTWQTVYES